MLHGILFILKIIGILLLAVLGLILAVLLLALLVPVRYCLKASVLEKKPDVDVRVTWLLHLLSVRARYHPTGGPFDLAVRILGIRLGGREKKGKDYDAEANPRDLDEEETGSEESGDAFGEEQLLELLEEGPADADGSSKEAEEGKAEAAAGPGEETSESQEASDAREGWTKADQAVKDQDKEKDSLTRKIRQSIDKIWNILQSLPKGVEKVKQNVEKLAEKKNSLVEFIQDADNQSLFRLLLKQTGGVFRHIRPRKLKLYLHFGFVDPSMTGKLLGYASVFYAYYYKTVDLVPEFQTDTMILEGNLYAKGRVRAGTLLCKGVRLLFNKGCRKLIKKVLKR